MDDLEMGTISETTKSGYIETQVAGCQDHMGINFRKDGAEKEEGIFKTVQLHQYTDGETGARRRDDDDRWMEKSYWLKEYSVSLLEADVAPA